MSKARRTLLRLPNGKKRLRVSTHLRFWLGLSEVIFVAAIIGAALMYLVVACQ
ncbi:hypothetical protein GCM10029992_37750 [Glycomyces albus]